MNNTGQLRTLNVFDDGGKIDLQIIEEFEAKTGHTFPEDYKSLLSQHDYLSPEENTFDFKFDEKCHSRDISFFGYDESCDDERIHRVQQDENSHDNIVVFGGSANGDFVCFDYRSNLNTPTVIVMFHDMYDNASKMITTPVSSTFEDFIDSLYIPES